MNIPYVSEVPELMKLWSKTGNPIGLASRTRANSRKTIAKWICPKCGEEFSRPVCNVWKGAIYCQKCVSNKNVYNAIDERIRKEGSLLDNFPHLEKYWDYEMNKKYPHKGRYLPSEFLSNSNVMVFWKCPDCNHKWGSKIITRTKAKFPCPECLKSNYSSLVFGREPLCVTHPSILSMWDDNNKVSNNVVTAHDSKTKVKWVCPRGHRFQKTPNYFINVLKGRCPECQKEIQTSFPEQAIYFYLSKVTTAINRAKINGEEVDIYLPDKEIGIEYDGSYWHNKKDYREIEKDLMLNFSGLRKLRIKERNPSHPRHMEDVIFVKDKSEKELMKAIKALFKKIGLICPDIDINRDKVDIYNQYVAQIKSNSIAKKRPYLLKEWNYARNKYLDPEYFSQGSKAKVWWICENGHEWEAVINSRRIHGCPYCAGVKCIPGETDFATLHPDLLNEWDYKANKGVDPKTIACGTRKKVHWICKQCGHRWKSPVYSRACNGESCPECSQKQRYITRLSNLIAKNGSFAQNYPELLKEWDYDKNEGIDPYKIAVHSKLRVGWVCCQCGHHWETTVDGRIGKKTGCPECYKKGLKKAQQQRAVKKHGSVATTNPELIIDWDKDNNEYKPDELCAGSHEPIRWKCHSCQHEWTSALYKRAVNHHRCPNCKGKGKG